MITLLIADDYDLHVDSIAYFLKDGFVRKSPNELFGNLLYSSHKNNYLGNIDLSSKNIKNIFFRFAFEDFISPDQEKTALENFSKAEFGKAIMSSLLTLDASKWFNYPYYEMQADIKPFSLKSAMALKIKVPEFIISNKRNEIINFSKNKKVIIKSISNADLAIQNNVIKTVPEFSDFQAGYTNEFSIDKAIFENWDNTPVLIQKRVEKVLEVRTLIIKDKIFTVATEPDSQNIDIRKSVKEYSSYSCPRDLEKKLLELVEILQLKICTFDILLDKKDNLWLIDINPQGNWLGFNQSVDMQISKEIAMTLREHG